jgi:hypothetical protein
MLIIKRNIPLINLPQFDLILPGYFTFHRIKLAGYSVGRIAGNAYDYWIF